MLTQQQADALAGPLVALAHATWMARLSVPVAQERPSFRRLGPTLGRRFRRARRLSVARVA